MGVPGGEARCVSRRAGSRSSLGVGAGVHGAALSQPV